MKDIFDVKPDIILTKDIAIDPNGFKVIVLGKLRISMQGLENEAESRAPTCPEGGEDRLQLWAHLVSMHAACVPTDLPLARLLEMHSWEHNGPGGIRNHDEALRTSSLHRIGHILSEVEPDEEDKK